MCRGVLSKLYFLPINLSSSYKSCFSIDSNYHHTHNTFLKGYSRLGAALTYLNKDMEALQAYEEGLKHDPNNAQLKNSLREQEATDGLIFLLLMTFSIISGQSDLIAKFIMHS